MNDEIKEILDNLRFSYEQNKELYEKYNQDVMRYIIHLKEAELLLDYITNLQEKLKVSQTNEETYRLEMQDITKCLGLKEDTIFDEVKEYATNLQEENERLKDTMTKIKDLNTMKYLSFILQGEDKENLYKYTPEKGFRRVEDVKR